MRHGTLKRTTTSDHGTFGQLVLDDGSTFCTGELPWRKNRKGLSCVPTGTYICVPFMSKRHGMCYLLQDVPGRSDVEIHSANFMGDRTLGYHCELLGCIALGESIDQMDSQRCLLNSKKAIRRFMEAMQGRNLELTIQEDYGQEA